MDENELSKLYYQLLGATVPSDCLPDSVRLETAKRAAASWLFQLKGYQQTLTQVIKDALYPVTNTSLVVVEKISFSSMCEHHLLPITGFCHIAYLPDQYWLGLSKFARIVEMFARRLQLQERLTQEIAQAVQQVTQAQGVGVLITAQHCCMSIRGVERREAKMTTTSRLGVLQKPEWWQQFMSAIRHH